MINNVVIIDAENLGCSPKVIEDCLNKYHKVYIVFSHLLTKWDFNTIATFASDIKNEKLNIIKMDNHGKNSADFGIAFLAGQLSNTLNKKSIIEIRSKDLMFKNIISMLIKSGFVAKQVFYHPISTKNNIRIVQDTENISVKNSKEENKSYHNENVTEIDLIELNSNILEDHFNDSLCDLDFVVSHEGMTELKDNNNGIIEESIDFPDTLLNSKLNDISKQVSNNLEEVIEKTQKYSFLKNIQTSNKTNKILSNLIKLIKENKFKRKSSLNIFEDCIIENNFAKIILNCIYIYGKFTHKINSRSYRTVITHFTNTHGFSKQFSIVFVSYLASCNLLKIENRYITNNTDFKKIIEDLEDVISTSILNK